MDHSAHEPGTVADCPTCRDLTYEPGWYKVIREERVVMRDPGTVLVPEVGDREVEVVVAEDPVREVLVPELEATEPEPLDP